MLYLLLNGVEGSRGVFLGYLCGCQAKSMHILKASCKKQIINFLVLKHGTLITKAKNVIARIISYCVVICVELLNIQELQE
jgi:hypothetical protein